MGEMAVMFLPALSPDNLATYFDVRELIEILETMGKEEDARKLRAVDEAGSLPVIADRAYISDAGLEAAGVGVNIGWAYSSHTPVSFVTYAENG